MTDNTNNIMLEPEVKGFKLTSFQKGFIAGASVVSAILAVKLAFNTFFEVVDEDPEKEEPITDNDDVEEEEEEEETENK